MCLLLVGILFLVAGCKEETVEGIGPFIGGVDGVTISFKEGAPITEFSKGESVPVSVLLKNNGEYTIPSGFAYVRLYGIKHDNFGLSPTYTPISGELRGAQKDFLEEGGEQEVSFGSLTYNLDVRGKLDQTLRAKICYPYKTEARINTCASSREISEAGSDEVCTVEGEKIVSGGVSKAPVQLTSFTERLIGTDQVAFTMEFANQHTGEVFNSEGKCEDFDDATTSLSHAGMIKIDLFPEDVICSFVGQDANSGYLNVKDGPKKLVCTMTVNSAADSSYVEEVTVNVDYKYIDSTSVDLTILG